MCTHNQCFRAKKKNIIIFHLKINIFTAVKYCCLLHGSVGVMIKDMFVCKKNIQVRNMYVLHRHLKKVHVYANKPYMYDLILKLFHLLCSMGFEKSIFRPTCQKSQCK